MNWFTVFGDIVINILYFLALDLFVKHFSLCIIDKKYYKIKYLFVLIWIILSLTHIPSITLFVILVDFLYILLISKASLRKKIVLLIQFEFYYIVANLVIRIIQTFISGDAYLFLENQVYSVYFSITTSFLTYMALYLYIILKKLSEFPTGKVYRRYFLIISTSLSLLLIVSAIFVGSNALNQKDVAQIFFSLLLSIAFLSLSIYRKVVSVLEENMLSKIEIEKNALEKEYAIQVEENVKKLAILRHDFKNHLIIIQGYVQKDRKEDLLAYMQELTAELSTTTLVDTPCQLLSTLVNAKKADCDHANVAFDFKWDFQAIHISEFALTTLISNILDNALRAAAKRSDGFIKLQVYEQNGFLEIDCTNNHKEIITKEGDNFVTTKSYRPELHGLGLISVRKTVEKLRGELNIDYTDDLFHINMLVPNYK